MNRRIWTGVVAGVLAAAVLLTVGIGAYRARQDDEVVTRVVGGGEPGGTEVVRVVGDHHGFGPGPFFFLFPLLIILFVVFLARRAWGHGYGHGHWGHGWGPGGPGGPGWHRSYGPGFGRGPGYGWMDEWHRQAHEEEGGRAPAGSATSTGPATAPEGSAADESPEPPASGA